VRGKYLLTLLVLSFSFLGILSVYGVSNDFSPPTIKQTNPSFDFVGYTTGEPIYNNSVVYSCINLTIVINVSNAKALDYLKVMVNSLTTTYNLSLQVSATIIHTIPIAGSGIYHVSIVVVNANGDETWYFFDVVCCDDTPPNITVSIDDTIIPPYTIYEMCGNATVSINITDIVGLGYVEIDVIRNGSLFSRITDTPGGNTSYSVEINISIMVGDTYVIVVHAIDMCQNSIEYEYTITCSEDDKPPIIWNVTACNMLVRPGACICCCKSPIVIIASDDRGITHVDLFINTALSGSRTFTPPATSIACSFTLDLPEGVYMITIRVYDTSGELGKLRILCCL